eukprot:362931-Chlamydomonas_euryale.AAC.3
MYDTYIRRLNATEVKDTMAAFASRSMPGCIGAIDITHVMIRKPACSYVGKIFNVRYDSSTFRELAITSPRFRIISSRLLRFRLHVLNMDLLIHQGIVAVHYCTGHGGGPVGSCVAAGSHGA